MKKYLLFVFLAIFLFSGSYAQKTVSGKSNSTRLVLKPDFKRGLPPDLYVDLNLEMITIMAYSNPMSRQ